MGLCPSLLGQVELAMPCKGVDLVGLGLAVADKIKSGRQKDSLSLRFGLFLDENADEIVCKLHHFGQQIATQHHQCDANNDNEDEIERVGSLFVE